MLVIWYICCKVILYILCRQVDVFSFVWAVELGVNVVRGIRHRELSMDSRSRRWTRERRLWSWAQSTVWGVIAGRRLVAGLVPVPPSSDPTSNCCRGTSTPPVVARPVRPSAAIVVPPSVLSSKGLVDRRTAFVLWVDISWVVGLFSVLYFLCFVNPFCRLAVRTLLVFSCL